MADRPDPYNLQRVSASRLQRVVFLVHGINSRGEWFDAAKEALEPHFKCECGHFDGYAKILAAVPKILAAPHRPLVRKLADAFTRARNGSAGRPHIIAHSYGSYLTQRMFVMYERARCDTVFLVGSVAAQRTDWLSLHKRESFRRLFNVVGHRDRIARLGSLASLFRGKFGSIGAVGIPPAEDLVPHDLTEWNCAGDPICDAPIHNVHREDFGHSDFLTVAEIREYVLPVLWGIPPAEYARYIDLCKIISAQNQLGRDAIAEQDALANTKWTWCKGRTLEDVLVGRMADRNDPETAASYALAVLCDFVAAAWEHVSGFNDQGDQACLDPEVALDSALVEALARFQ